MLSPSTDFKQHWPRHGLHNQRPVVIVRTHRRTWSEQQPTNNIVDLLWLFMGKITVVRIEIEIAYGVDNDHGPRLIWASFWPLLPCRPWTVACEFNAHPSRFVTKSTFFWTCVVVTLLLPFDVVPGQTWIVKSADVGSECYTGFWRCLPFHESLSFFILNLIQFN